VNVNAIQKWRIIHNLGIVYKQPKLELEKGVDYGERKKVINRCKKVVTPTEHERPVVTVTGPNHILTDPTFFITPYIENDRLSNGFRQLN
jgi:hypothetical protein